MDARTQPTPRLIDGRGVARKIRGLMIGDTVFPPCTPLAVQQAAAA